MIRQLVRIAAFAPFVLLASFVGSPNDPGYATGGGATVGTLAARPATPSSSGALYFTSDTLELFIGSGGAWSSIGRVGTTVANGVKLVSSGGGYSFDNAEIEQSSATAGSASALPATPAGYLQFRTQSASTGKIPFYNV